MVLPSMVLQSSQIRQSPGREEKTNQCGTNVNTPALGMLAALVPALPAGLQRRYCTPHK
jgi:hypothetical protein